VWPKNNGFRCPQLFIPLFLKNPLLFGLWQSLRPTLEPLSPLKWQHVHPYGTFTANMYERLPLEQLAGSPVQIGQNLGLRPVTRAPDRGR
jgi:hypothetical protein